MVSGRDEDKFAAAELTPVRSDLVDAPYVKEFPMVVECRLAHTIDGMADIKKVRPLVFTPDTQAYYGIGTFIAKAFSVGERI
jgi:hypothetical protein